MFKKELSARTLVTSALLVALSVILRLLGFPQSGIFRIELGFAPIAVCGSLYGAAFGGLSYVAADLIGTLATGMTPFFPITVCKFFIGAFFGLFFHEGGKSRLIKGSRDIKSIVICNLAIAFVVDLVFMPLALLPISGGKTFWAIVSVRALALLFNIPLRIFTIWFTFKYLSPERLGIKS